MHEQKSSFPNLSTLPVWQALAAHHKQVSNPVRDSSTNTSVRSYRRLREGRS
ncbi:hypothetical protein D8I24_4114 (plasmid) [Cupriavidus necator H850]|uniref:hypothetical protein n=1 Tax=Cupriavidus necator TaxID=106590 RepID=UPI003FA41365|nr:hypothetical protein D8I24_4114 [Cupriavidus necator H850]